jgi:hypothetical protein
MIVSGIYRYAGKIVTIGDLADCAERELRRRKRDYPPKVARHRMSKYEADWGIALMAAIVERLRDEEKAELLV